MVFNAPNGDRTHSQFGFRLCYRIHHELEDGDELCVAL